ncbi:MAG: beta strand repeat-containing protein [Terracidiphilus sp.]
MTVAAAASTVDGSDTTTLTATVANDKNSAGVTWSVSGGGTLSSETTSSATYTAPAATTSSQSVTITATSVADTAKTGTATLTIPAAPAVTSTSASLVGAVGTAYSVQLQASGGISPYTWALGSGTTLPTCLTLKSSGIITTASGTAPTASCAGTYSDLTFKVTDSGTPTALSATSSPLSIAITAPTITFPTSLSPSSVTVGTAYSASAAATGALGTTTYSLVSGALPASGDLVLNASTGAIAGTPKAADVGTYTFTVQVVDAYGDSATSGSLSITVNAPTITFPTSLSPSSVTVGTAYSASAAATGPVGTTTYTIASGALPASGDLVLNASTGAIAGTPKAADVGKFTFTVKVVDAYGDSATSGSLSITVNAPTITFPTSLSPSSVTVGSAYSASAAATGAVGTTTYSLVSGALPASGDLVLNASTGAITGTPKAADVGPYTFTVKVVDAYGDTATSGSLSITVNAAATITFGTAPTATATAGVSYSSTLSASGGAGSLTYSIVSGSLPAGLTLTASTGAIAGTPTTATGYTFTAQAADSYGDTPATQAYTITVSPGSATHFTVAVTSTTPVTAGGTVSFTVTALDVDNNVATGYTGTVAFTSTDSQASLPSASALVSGTGIGSFSATLKTAGSQTITATDTVTTTIAGTSAGITVNPGTATKLAVTAPSSVTTGVAFNFTVTAKDAYNNTATGFADSVQFTSSDGSAVLPSASALTSGTGTFSVTLKTTGSQTVTATDASNASINGTSSTINVTTALTVTTTTLPAGDANASYSQTLAAAGGSGTYSSWAITAGGSTLTALNLSLNTTTGVISGTPTASGTASFTVQVTDSKSATASQPLTITINSALSLPTPDPSSLPSTAYVGVAYNGGNGGTITGSGGSGNLSIAVDTGLPSDGLSGSPSGAVLTVSGTPATAETVTFSVTLTDTTTSNSITQTGYNITVSTPVAVGLPTPNPSSLGSAVEEQSYTGAINASGGVSPYTWTINGNSVGSSGYSLGNGTLAAYSTGGNTLSISGIPSATGTVTLTNVKVVDAANSNATNTYTITVNATEPLTITINDVPQGMVNMPYTYADLNITGGQSPYTITYSNLPAGLAQSSTNSYEVVGTPTSTGTTVTVKVTDSATSQNVASTTFSLPVVAETTGTNNSKLKGQYACYVQEYWDGGVTGGNGTSTLYRGGVVFAFAANGSGSITGGEVDSNSPHSGYHSASSNGAAGGTYAVGSDNRGYLNLTVGGSNAALFALAGGNLNSSSQFTEFSIQEMDDVGADPSGNWSGGHCYQQNTTGLSGSQASGGYVWAWRGEDREGNLEAAAGSGQFSGGNLSGIMDMVDDGVYQGDVSIIGTYTTTDSYGRMTMNAGPTIAEENPSVIYLTNNSVGEGVFMAANPHNAASNADFDIGEVRAQNAAHVAASYPINGPFVLYMSGLDSDLSSYNAEVVQGTGSSSAASFTLHADISNNGGTIKSTCPSGGACPSSLTYTANSSTGRTTLTGQSGIVFYVYDTNSAVALFGDTGGGSNTQNLLGWMEPQTAPSSGTWTVSDLAANLFMYKVINGDVNLSPNNTSFTIDSSGAFTSYAEDDGGQQQADWDEGLCGGGSGCGGTVTGAIVPDTTANATTGALGLDPNGTIGVFDAQGTQGSTTQTMAYCIAISVDQATNSSTKGHFVCLDASSKHPALSIGQE